MNNLKNLLSILIVFSTVNSWNYRFSNGKLFAPDFNGGEMELENKDEETHYDGGEITKITYLLNIGGNMFYIADNVTITESSGDSLIQIAYFKVNDTDQVENSFNNDNFTFSINSFPHETFPCYVWDSTSREMTIGHKSVCELMGLRII